jgi:hypothetical protein
MSEKDTTPVEVKDTTDVKAEDLETRRIKNKRFLPATGEVVTARTAAEATKKAAKESK